MTRKKNLAQGMTATSRIFDSTTRTVIEETQAALVALAQDLDDLTRRLGLTDDMPVLSETKEFLSRVEWAPGVIRVFKRRVTWDSGKLSVISPDMLAGEISLAAALVGTTVSGTDGGTTTTVYIPTVYAGGWADVGA